MANSNVVAAVRQHVAQYTSASFAKAYPGGATPAQLGAAVGYAGKRASQLRAYVARQHGAGTKAQGITRYPALSYGQWCKLFALAERTAKAQGDGNANAATAASANVRKLWQAARKGGKQAKAQAS
jgi:hypothetical protein